MGLVSCKTVSNGPEVAVVKGLQELELNHENEDSKPKLLITTKPESPSTFPRISLFNKNKIQIHSDVSDESYNFNKSTPKTVRTDTNRTNLCASDSNSFKQSGKIPQASRLSCGSVESLHTPSAKYPINQEIFSTCFEGSAVFAKNKKARNAFIKYIKGKTWVDQLSKPLRIMKAGQQSLLQGGSNFMMSRSRSSSDDRPALSSGGKWLILLPSQLLFHKLMNAFLFRYHVQSI